MKKIIIFTFLLCLVLVACSPKKASEPVRQPVNEVKVPEQKGAELKDQFLKQGDLQFTAHYNVKTKIGEDTQTTSMTQYFSGFDKVRTDVETQGVETRNYFLNNLATSCVNAGSWQCNQIQQDPALQITSQLQNNPESFDVTSIGPRTVAGVKTECYTIKPDTGILDYCFSEEGVPLYVRIVKDGISTEQQATRYELNVLSSDFILPN